MAVKFIRSIHSTESWEWNYVGEAGVEVVARNSHSMCILDCDGVHYLVIYGGASPEHGPLGDVVYAQLPDASTIGLLVLSVSFMIFSDCFFTRCKVILR